MCRPAAHRVYAVLRRRIRFLTASTLGRTSVVRSPYLTCAWQTRSLANRSERPGNLCRHFLVSRVCWSPPRACLDVGSVLLPCARVVVIVRLQLTAAFLWAVVRI